MPLAPRYSTALVPVVLLARVLTTFGSFDAQAGKIEVLWLLHVVFVRRAHAHTRLQEIDAVTAAGHAGGSPTPGVFHGSWMPALHGAA